MIKVLNGGRSRVEKKKNIVGHVKELVGGARKGVDATTHFPRNETETDTDGGVSAAPSDMDMDASGAGLLTVLTSAADFADVMNA